jgi:hypothetical protein
VSFTGEDGVLDLQLRRTCPQTIGEIRRIINRLVCHRRSWGLLVTAHGDEYPKNRVVPGNPLEKGTFVCQDVWVDGGAGHQIRRKPAGVPKHGSKYEQAANRVAPDGLAIGIDA